MSSLRNKIKCRNRIHRLVVKDQKRVMVVRPHPKYSTPGKHVGMFIGYQRIDGMVGIGDFETSARITDIRAYEVSIPLKRFSIIEIKQNAG